ncbi:hypothetical protein JI752_019155 [Lysobacter sp. MMG2]|uniref:hypothetical protein n=1 Tax=Lysobacter sp. MMG2 TaxID=2801338 RepID=UPI001C248427|nr:hypothetical protein [Lysobacter sp. MMG2]MBU8978270.1 hypothetical protein [Lysobacter sp. MMG2]
MGFATFLHSLVAFDLVLNFLPATPEIRALWAVDGSVKALWLCFVAVGSSTVIAFGRAPRAGFALSLLATGCLYFASIGLWHEIKGGFWICIAANLVAAWGVWSNRAGSSAAA